MVLEREVQSLLRTREVQEIAFTMRGIRVTGPGFRELSTCISDGFIPRRVRVVVAPGLVGRRAQAAYDSRDVILLRSLKALVTPAGCGTVIHECTHAQIDLRGTSTPIRSEEGAAFIAQAWYYLACGWTIATIDAEFPADIEPIATDLRERSKQAGGAAVELTQDQINDARRAMVRLGYDDGHYFSNGVRRHPPYRGP